MHSKTLGAARKALRVRLSGSGLRDLNLVNGECAGIRVACCVAGPDL